MKTAFLIGTLLPFTMLVAGQDVAGQPPAASDRESKIPATAAKVTPQTDAHPPKLHVDLWDAPVPLPPAINTAGAEDSPYVTADGNTLYFWFTPDVKVPPHKQIIDGATGIYASKKQAGRWGKAERIILQEPDEVSLEGAPVVQGNTMWFGSVRRGNFREIDFYTAKFRDGRWCDWANAGRRLNQDLDVGELHVTADGKEIYFHGNLPGGKGQNDIWVTRNVGGQWQDPEDVESVNSVENESQPFVTYDGREMWITKRHRGCPGVFKSIKVDGKWQQPELILSMFAGEPTVDAAGNIYFVHHFFEKGTMIEADIYFAKKK